MKHSIKKLVAGTALALGALGAFAADPIKIGSVLSVTGPAAFLGDPELKTLLHGEENREVPKLLSVPDLAEHTPGEIEVRFLQEAERLGVYGSDR